MSRPLFEIALEIASDWKNPSPAAKSYLKGMHYLLGMDDRAGDLDAPTVVRLFLLYAKEWQGSAAERIKAELQAMRSSNAPQNAELLARGAFVNSKIKLESCELCSAFLGKSGKFVEGYSQWRELAKMCMHCNYFVATGLDRGDGALYIQHENGSWIHLHGTPKLPPPRVQSVRKTAFESPMIPIRPKLRYRVKNLLKTVMKRAKRKSKHLYARVFTPANMPSHELD